MKKKRVLISILLIIAVLFSATNVFAALDDVDDVMIDEGDNIENGYAPIPTNQNNRNTTVNTNQNSNAVVKDGNDMPNTGIEDLPIVAIGICIVSAVVAYTQIKRYNV